MATTNLRQTIEGTVTAVTGSSEPHPFRRPGVFAMILRGLWHGSRDGAYVTVAGPEH